MGRTLGESRSGGRLSLGRKTLQINWGLIFLVAATTGVGPGERNTESRPSRRKTRQATLTTVKTPSSSNDVTLARLATTLSSRLAT